MKVNDSVKSLESIKSINSAQLQVMSSASMLVRRMNRSEKELYKTATQKEGLLYKKSSKFFVGFQLKYFKIISNGQYLVYYDAKHKDQIEFRNDLKPNGVFEMESIYEIEKTNPNNFQFKYGNRLFHFKTDKSQDCDLWITCLKFLSKVK